MGGGGGGPGGGGERDRWIRMIYSFMLLPLMKGCRRMTYTVHTVIMPMSKKTNKLTTMYLIKY